ncbi:amidase family protein [Corynebacterium urealyticum]|uniref:amidase family protein n=1 Tax=Corynebacterium urealyticum TaxID=43771 RepID=UPI00293E3C60|nr:amidase family protein [Corynebacterium urealyticum]WOH95438.1 amidase family protein [Corynebacterium urealyticum]
MRDAASLDQLDPSERGALHGVPIAIKEELDVAGAVTSFGTRANHTPKTADSAVVARLRAAGAIIIGKTHMPEFGAYPLTSSQGYGVTRNPIDLSRTPGGRAGERSWRVAWLDRSSTPFIPVATANREARKRAAAQLEAQGVEVRPLSARLPDPTLPFLILMFAGIRSEIGLLEKPERIEKRHRLTKLVGALMRPKMVSWAERRAATIGRKVSDIMAREGIDAILTPTVADRPRRADLLVGKGAIRASLLSMPSIAYTAMWNVAGQPALAVPMGQGSDGLPTSVQMVGDVGAEKKLLDLARELA